MTNPQTAVAVIEQSPDAVVEWNLDQWPSDRFLRLIPTQTLGMVTDLLRPIVQVVQLDIETDTYESNDLKQGHRAPNAKGLSKLAGAAGVNFVDEERLDDGRDPGRAYVRVYAEMIDATGYRRRAPGSRDYVLDSQPMTDAQRRRAKGFVHEHAATRARHRALRALLSLPQSYPVAELAKPFAVVSFVPNLQNPELRSRVLDAMVPTIASLYGTDASRQLASGSQIVEVAEVPDEPKNVTPAPATPTVLPGEKLAAAAAATPSDEPEWMQITITETAAGTLVQAAPAEVDVVALIRDTAIASGMKGPATAPQLEKLKGLLGGLTPPGVTTTALVYIWDETVKSALTAAQAQSLANVADSLGTDEFHAAIRAIAERARVAA